jgi:hypothetical protein
MAQLYDNYMFSTMANIPFGLFTSFLANMTWSSVLMKKVPTLSCDQSKTHTAFRRKRKSRLVSIS